MLLEQGTVFLWVGGWWCLVGWYREQARSYSWVGYIRGIWVGCEGVIASKLAPTGGFWDVWGNRVVWQDAIAGKPCSYRGFGGVWENGSSGRTPSRASLAPTGVLGVVGENRSSVRTPSRASLAPTGGLGVSGENRSSVRTPSRASLAPTRAKSKVDPLCFSPLNRPSVSSPAALDLALLPLRQAEWRG